MRGFVRLLMFLAGGSLALAFLVPVALHSNGSIETDVWIDRPPDDVWRVLTATSSYGSWNPMICRLSGDLLVGNKIEFVEGPSPSEGMVFHPTVLVANPPRELTWKGYVWIPGIFDGKHSFILEGTGSKTHFIQREQFSGLFAGRLTRSILVETSRQMAAMNLALKRRVESNNP